MFINESYKVSKHVELITPARFLFNAGATPKDWNQKILSNPHVKVLFFERDPKKIFPNTSITGGITITYFDEEKKFIPIGIFSVYSELNSIKEKVGSLSSHSFSEMVANRGLYRYSDTAFNEQPEEMKKTADRRIAPSCFERMPSLFTDKKPDDNHKYIKIYGSLNGNRVYKWFRKDYVEDVDNLGKYKVMMPKANGASGMICDEPARIISKPEIGEPQTGFTETFIAIGNTDSKQEAEAILKYTKSKFARTMLGIMKVTQNNAKPTWEKVPMQDFTLSSDIDWSKSIHEIDEQLYKKYKLSKEEIDFIESHVKEME